METTPLLHIQYDHTDFDLFLNLISLVLIFEVINTSTNKFWRKLNKLLFTLFLGGMIGVAYFTSAVYKIYPDTHFYNWILDNNFTYTVAYYFNFGGDIFGGNEGLKMQFINFCNDYHVLIQALTFGIEFLFLFFLLNRKIAWIAFVGIVIFHLLFFSFSGILFWKWIVVGALFFVVLKRENIYRLPLKSRIIATIFFLVVGNFIFLIPKLGWKDPAKVSYYQWAYQIPKQNFKSKNPYSFSNDSATFISINPATFFPYEKNMGMSWKFYKVKENELDFFFDMMLPLKSHPPLYNHLWFQQNYFDVVKTLPAKPIRIVLLKRNLHFAPTSFHFTEIAPPQLIYQYPICAASQE
ncbi:MAG: hypothetical protein NTX03_02330 [Bacteroidetes bacterium]|nr:hypothetical protein [Bacteroidota bacterium]